ncbi:esterase/lipase family protein [Caldimonas thermodepolymerans]|jgi:hypothetical protein|uniref:PGAP1-like protein n=1 Tax=Caldimonas thermodepolymerans TaxID=215580 RepID=A0AA46DEY6_9BURK|nr:hypothetical protein [Caldimonas thermodepolymerans]TCP07975.1 hypothetical protein EV676_1033 [Caldimonas thermodepolymerans]UZG48898.1 hypothetical protein ONS87_04560 [Caldimonas thermodepolymerans]
MAETLERNETVRRIEPEFDGRGRPVWHSQLTPPDESCAQCVMVPDRVIPVIFVPGVMGSNLKPKGDDGPRWRMDGALSALAWIFRGPKTRKKFLQPGVMEVDQDGKVPKDMAVPAEELRRRGWGEISAMSYSGALRWLEEHLNDFSRAREGLRVRLMQEALGAEVGEACLTHEEVRLSYRYRFPVHACGYNWLADNVDSAHTLGARIDEIIARYNQTDRMRCEKVILVTHSMGGLVARYCSEVLGYRDRILGIVHGVMPAIGAAAVYRRMKAGTETNGSLAGWAAAQVIGANAEEMTAVLSTAPGPLQLLPSAEYGDGWLKIRGDGQEVALPRSGNPYQEIYAARGVWWALCDPALMNPVNEERDPVKRAQQVEDEWRGYERLILERVRVFHRRIAHRYHAQTYAFIGDSNRHKAYGSVAWVMQAGPPVEPVDRWLEGDAPPDQLDNGIVLHQKKDRRSVRLNGSTVDQAEFVISPPDAPGDGTVPSHSGLAPKPHCQGFMRVEVEHEPAFNPKGEGSAKALLFTLRAIVRIAQRVRESQFMMYEDLG